MQTGRAESGLPCAGSWCSYGLGSENRDLPAFIFMMSGTLDQPITTRYFHSGILPAQHQGVQFLPAGDPVLYLSNPPGLSAGRPQRHRRRHQRAQPHPPSPKLGDPEIEARIHSFELAFRMQTAVPDLIDIQRREPARRSNSTAPTCSNPGTFARQCLLARRLVERGVRFVQLFHRGWDAHNDVIGGLRRQVRDVDQPIAALIRDLKHARPARIHARHLGRRVRPHGVWPGRPLAGAFGRDHHPRCFTIWLAGGGIKPGMSIGSTDDFGYNIAEHPVHVNDLHATILHCLGIDHTRLTYRFGGRDFRLTDLAGEVVREVLA